MYRREHQLPGLAVLIVVAALLALFGIVIASPAASASIPATTAAAPVLIESTGYTTHTCTPVSGTRLTVTTWFDDAHTQKTYHFTAYAVWPSHSVRGVTWNGVAIISSRSDRVEGYRYLKSYLGVTPWSASFQNYWLGIPTTRSWCGFNA